jgi:hypothetical protein
MRIMGCLIAQSLRRRCVGGAGGLHMRVMNACLSGVLIRDGRLLSQYGVLILQRKIFHACRYTK